MLQAIVQLFQLRMRIKNKSKDAKDLNKCTNGKMIKTKTFNDKLDKNGKLNVNNFLKFCTFIRFSFATFSSIQTKSSTLHAQSE